MSAFRNPWSDGLITRLAKWILRYRLVVYRDILHTREKEAANRAERGNGQAMAEHQVYYDVLCLFEKCGLGSGEDNEYI